METRVLLFFLLASVLSARADIYLRMTDGGEMHFSNAPTGPEFKLVLRSPQEPLPAPAILYQRARSLPTDLRPSFLAMVQGIAGRYGVEVPLVLAVIQAESNFNPRAVSPKGAQGLMQLMPSTADQHQVRDVSDPRQNVEGGVRHIRYLLDRYGGDILLALSAYNAGPRKVEIYGDVPPYRETMDYLLRVVENYEFYSRYQGKNPQLSKP